MIPPWSEGGIGNAIEWWLAGSRVGECSSTKPQQDRGRPGFKICLGVYGKFELLSPISKEVDLRRLCRGILLPLRA